MALLDAGDVVTATRIIQDLSLRATKAPRTEDVSSDPHPSPLTSTQPQTAQEIGVAASARRSQPPQAPVPIGMASGRGPSHQPASVPDPRQDGFIVVASDMRPNPSTLERVRASAESVFMARPKFKNAHINPYAEENWARQQERINQTVREGLAFARAVGANSGYVASARDPNHKRCVKPGETSFIVPCLTDDGVLPSDMFEAIAKTVEYVARTCAYGASQWEVQTAPAAPADRFSDQGKRFRA